MYQFLKTNNFQIFKFLVSGVFASAINFITFNFIFILFNNILLASLVGYVLGLLSSFFLAKIWVFKNISKKPVLKSFFIFFLIYLLGGLEMSITIVCLNKLIDNYKIAWLLGAFVGSLNNYLGSKYLLFKNNYIS